MYKNQLQELAQRSCFGLPSYTWIREGPDHAPRFRAAVNFNGEVFESPAFCPTVRQAEHAAAEVALNALSSSRSPSRSLAARFLDETGVYKNLLQEISQRTGVPLPSYTTSRSGLPHQPAFTCTVELAGLTFTSAAAKNKKQAEKYAAMEAWNSLKRLAKEAASSTSGPENNTDEQEQITVARALLNLTSMANNCPSVPVKFTQEADTCRSSHAEQGSAVITGSRILPNLVLHRPKSATRADGIISLPSCFINAKNSPRHDGADRCMIAPPVTIRTAVPVFSAPQQKKHHVPQKKHELQYRAAAPAPQLCVQLKEPPTTIPASRKQVYPVNFPDSLKESQGPAW